MNKKITMPKALLYAAIIVGITVSLLTFLAVRTLSQGYHEMTNVSLTSDYRGMMIYDDKMYGQIAFGIELSRLDPWEYNQKTMNDFLVSSITQIDQRVYSGMILYAMMISVIMVLYLYDEHAVSPSVQAITVLGIYAVLICVFYFSCYVMKVPFYLPKVKALLMIAVSLLSVMAGNCAVSLLFGLVSKKGLAAVILIPVVFALFMISTSLEGKLYSPEYIDSFSYLVDIVPENSEEQPYYDETRNVVIYQGKEYPPEQLPNSDRLSGISRIGAFAFEIADPYSGNSLEMVRSIIDQDVPSLAVGMYTLKAGAWIYLAAELGKKKRWRKY